MVDVKKKTEEVEIEILNNVTKNDFANATAKMLADYYKLGELNPFMPLLVPVVAAELWGMLVEEKKKGDIDGVKED